MKSLFPFLLALLGVGIGCASPTSQEAPVEPAEEFTDGASDSAARPTLLGEIGTSQTVYGDVVPPGRAFPAYQLKLDKPATLTFTTMQGSGNAAPFDTMLYLYKQAGTTFRSVARDDNGAGVGKYSRIQSALQAGTYRIVVAAANRPTAGKFALKTSCSGEGCTAQARTCAFDASEFALLHDLTTIANAQRLINTESWVLDNMKTAAAVSGYKETRTLAQLFDASVDGWAIFQTRVGDETFYKYSFYPGDNEYGAIFDVGGEQVARINDGDVHSCVVFENPSLNEPSRECASAAMRAFDAFSALNRAGESNSLRLVGGEGDQEVIKITTDTNAFLVSVEGLGPDGCAVHGIQNVTDKSVLFPQPELDLVQTTTPFASHVCNAPLRAYIDTLEDISYGSGFLVGELDLRTAGGPPFVFGSVLRNGERKAYRANVGIRTTSSGQSFCRITAVSSASARKLAGE